MAVQELLVRLGLDDSSFTKQMQGINRDLKKHQAEFDALSSAVEGFEKTQEGMQKTLKFTEERIEKLSDVLSLNESKQQATRKELENLKDTYNDFDKSITSTKADLEDITEEFKSSSKESEKLKDKIKDLERIEKVFDDAEKSIRKNNKSLKEATEKHNNLAKETNTHRTAIKELNAVQEKQVGTLLDVKESLDKLRKKYNENVIEIEKTKRAYEQIIRKYGENSEQAITLKNNLEKLETQQESLNGSLDIARKQYEKINKTVQETDEKIKSHSKALNKAEKEITSLKKEISSYEKELEKQKKAQQDAIKELEKYNLSSVDTKQSIQNLKRVLAEKRAEIQKVDNVTAEYRAEMDKLEKQLIAEQQQFDKTKKAIAQKNKELQELEIASRKTEKEINELSKSAKQLQFNLNNFKLNELSNKLTTTGKTLTSIGDGLTKVGNTLTMGVSLPLAMAGKEITSTFTEFERRIRKVNAVFGSAGENMQKQFENISESARKFARETEWTATEVGEAYEYLAMAGLSVSEANDAMLPMLNLASIGMLDLGTATDIVTDTMTPFSSHLEEVRNELGLSKEEFNGAEYMVDIFAQTITKSNTTVELMGETLKYCSAAVASYGGDFDDLAVAIGAMASASIKGSNAGTSLSTGLNRLVKPTDKSKAVMEKYGIEVKKTSDGQLDLMATMEHLREKLGGLDEITRGSVATQIFGQTAQKGWLAIINAESEAWEDLKNSIANSTGATETMMDEMRKSGSYAFSIMKSRIDDLKISLGNALAPALLDIGEKIGQLALKISDWVSNMQETNPELLELIGKIGIMAVVIPPVISLLGFFTKGIGNIFSVAGGAVKGVINLKSAFGKLAEGTLKSTDKFAGLVKMLSKVTGVLGTTGSIVAVAGAAFVGLTAYIGSNEDALGWLVDKWGTFGLVVAHTCETIYGICQLVFGNIANMAIGLGKILAAVFSGKWGKIDDIWAETMAKCESTTAKAMSNIKGESSKALKEIQNSTKKDLDKVNEVFEVSLEKLPKVTKDNMGKVSKELTTNFKDLNDSQLKILRGTSDTMAVLFQGIKEGMSTKEMQKELEDNMKNLLRTGDISVKKLQSDFNKAQQLINDNIKDGYKQSKQEAESIMDEIGKITVNGINSVTTDISSILSKMDNETFVTLKGFGGKWEEMFKGIESTTDLSTKEAKKILKENLTAMGVDTQEGVDKLLTELNTKLTEAKEETSKNGQAIVEETSAAIEGVTTETSTKVTSLLDTLKSNTNTSVRDMATNLVTIIEQMGSDTANTLSQNGDYWYAILNGAFDESGKLSDGFVDTLIGNFNFLGIKTPEQAAELATKLEEEFNRMNINISGETENMKNEVSQDVEETATNVENSSNKIKESTKDTGKTVTENLTPENLEQKVKEQLDLAEKSLAEQKESFSNEAQQVAAEAEDKFRKELENMATVEIPDTILNVEKIKGEMGLAGQIAVAAFAESWTSNNYLITSAISNSFTSVQSMVTNQFAGIELSVQSLATKLGIAGDTASETKNRLMEIQTIQFNTPKQSAAELKKNLDNAQTSAKNFNSEMSIIKNISMSSINNSIKETNTRLKDVKSSAVDTKNRLNDISILSLSKLNGDMVTTEDKLKKMKNAAENAHTSIKKVANQTMDKINGQIGATYNKLESIKSKAAEAKAKLSEMNNVSFSTLTSNLSSIKSWLNSIKSSANSAKTAIGSVANAKRSTGISSVVNGVMGISEVSMASADAMMSVMRARTPAIDMSNYTTSGGYYSENSMAGSTARAKEIEAQKKVIDALQDQNQLLLQILAADRNINVSVDVDGRQIAKSTARYMDTEINLINKRKSRLGGAF